MKILVADDDPLSRAMIAVPLGAMPGVEMVEAADGDQAWKLLGQGTFGAAILDWRMPGKDGLKLTKAIRDAGSKIPILMVTVESERENVLKAHAAGVSDYLVKPFDPKVLWKKLSRLISDGQGEKSP